MFFEIDGFLSPFAIFDHQRAHIINNIIVNPSASALNMQWFFFLNVSQLRRDTLLCGLSHLHARQSQKYEKYTAVLFLRGWRSKKKTKAIRKHFTQSMTFSTRLRAYIYLFFFTHLKKNKRQKCVSNGVRAGACIFSHRHTHTEGNRSAQMICQTINQKNKIQSAIIHKMVFRHIERNMMRDYGGCTLMLMLFLFIFIYSFFLTPNAI